MDALTTTEQNTLEGLETVIEAGLQTFFAVGNALAEIRSQRLYRNTHDTFEAYCNDRWGMSRSYASRVIGAADVVANLLPIGNKGQPMPATESQARPLVGLEPDKQQKVWRTAVRKAGEGKITAAAVKQAVETVDHNEAQRHRIVVAREKRGGLTKPEYAKKLAPELADFLRTHKDKYGRDWRSFQSVARHTNSTPWQEISQEWKRRDIYYEDDTLKMAIAKAFEILESEPPAEQPATAEDTARQAFIEANKILRAQNKTAKVPDEAGNTPPAACPRCHAGSSGKLIGTNHWQCSNCGREYDKDGRIPKQEKPEEPVIIVQAASPPMPVVKQIIEDPNKAQREALMLQIKEAEGLLIRIIGKLSIDDKMITFALNRALRELYSVMDELK